ncbi:MAG: D-2-hydroxyacid dehydrogenase [Gammaproteobacteria bacterium]|jgi:glycerate dehydrogenase|nr:D-2-hydroxyacid dehydrogenase [Gammaproteobacteria bacterium]
MSTVFLDFDSLRPADLELQGLQRLASVKLFGRSTADEILTRLGAAETVVVNKVHLGDTELKAAPKLRLICLAATGSDNIDLEACTARGIAVCNIRNYCTPAVVQHVFALLLNLNQHLDAYRRQVAAGAWQRSPQFCLLEPPLRELQGQVLGIVGYGTLGRAVAAAGRAFGMQILAARLPGNPTPTADPDIRRLPLEALLEQSDCVSLHCPLTPTTAHLIDAPALQRMRREAVLINTARGGLVDSAALAAALRDGSIAGAGIDVLAEEPPVSDPLLDTDIPNLIVTPHMAWSARESRQRALDQIVANIEAFYSGEPQNRIA